ncbi:MAG: hypothetical protein LBC97_09810 [Bifidobacteriaceae bacterium]|nr:hypothetical protein [Bifidobacteriaceae bacterium]
MSSAQARLLVAARGLTHAKLAGCKPDRCDAGALEVGIVLGAAQPEVATEEAAALEAMTHWQSWR